MKVFWGLLPALITLPLVLPAQAPEVELEPVKTTVTVRAQVETPVASFVSTMNADSLESRPGVNLDDRLRDVPGFSLFRRSSSFVSHPTSQGVSLSCSQRPVSMTGADCPAAEPAPGAPATRGSLAQPASAPTTIATRNRRGARSMARPAFDVTFRSVKL